jgi:hypothetical protein
MKVAGMLSRLVLPAVVAGILFTLFSCKDEPSNGKKDIGKDVVEDVGGDVPLDRIEEDKKGDAVEFVPSDLDAKKDEPAPPVDVIDSADAAEEIEDTGFDAKPLCQMACQTHQDCEGLFKDLGVCEKAFCLTDQFCAQDDNPDNDKQCKPDWVDGCCVGPDDPECDDNNICTDETCVNNVCGHESASPLPEGCCKNEQFLFLDFEGVQVGMMPPEEKVYQKDSKPNDNVFWSVQESPCGTGKALYLGDPVCKTYYNGEFQECNPIAEMPCTEETADVDCPGQTCLKNKGTCLANPMPSQVKLELIAPEINPPADALTTLIFKLWMEAEYFQPGPEDLDLDWDALKVYAIPTQGPEEELYVSEVVENSTGGACITLGADLSAYAGQSLSIAWRFDTVGGEKNHHKGIYLDDIAVRTYCVEDTCLSNAKCDDDNKCTADQCAEFVNQDEGGLCLNEQGDDDCVECTDVTVCEVNNPHENPICFPSFCVKENPEDEEGVCQWPPDPDCCNPEQLADEPVYDEGFEAGVGTDKVPAGWKVEAQPDEEVKWQVVNKASCNESPEVPDADALGLYFGDPTGDPNDPVAGWNYDCGQAHCFGSVSTGWIDLASADESAFLKLTFLVKLGTEWDTATDPSEFVPKTGIDLLTVEAIPEDAGVAPLPLWNSDAIYGSTHGECVPIWADLTPMMGKKIRLKFTFDTSDSTPPFNTFFGALVDEISITQTCDQICTLDADCTQGGDCKQGTCTDGVCSYSIIPDCCTKAINPDCDDLDDCTADSCNLDTKTCLHEYSGDPQCCTPKDPLALESFEGEGVVDPTQKDPEAWMVPFPEDAPGLKCADQDCTNDVAEGGKESCANCPADCGPCTTGWQVVSHNCFAGDSCLYFGNPTKWTYENSVVGKGNLPAFGQMASAPFVFPEYGMPKVEFMLWLETEHCTGYELFVEPQAWDILRLKTMVADTPDSKVWSKPKEVWTSMAWDIKGCTKNQFTGQVEHWLVELGLDDPAYKGKAVKFLFEFDTLDDQNNAYEGVYIDSFKVSSQCIQNYECFSPAECGEATPADPNCSIETCDKKNHKCGSKPNTFKDGCCEQESLAKYDFDGPCGIEGWQAKPPAAGVKWQVHNGGGVCEGQCSLYFGNKTNYQDANGQPVSGTAYSPHIDLTDKNEIEVSFSLWVDVVDQEYWLDSISFGMDSVVVQDPVGLEQEIWHKPCNELVDVDPANGCLDPLNPTGDCLDYGCETLMMKQCVPYSFTVKVDACDEPGEKWPECYDWIPGIDRTAVFFFRFDSGDAAGNKGEGVYVDNFQVKTTCL